MKKRFMLFMFTMVALHVYCQNHDIGVIDTAALAFKQAEAMLKEIHHDH